ncbi:hypothetical protein EDC18_1195 [Natranaerovirga pectinivora]|uniref:Uncharacterized protein n=1 Tax=Natranaerovirga pectinivora TaxID=682400 RepID=A0A4R3MGY0_9FIRM|nr:hypothetical protein [Natranaerovirga pectinivora]TCT11617.1 hypothetical protein EDC18_1195 [Natranaerovirga pectinivora]
MKYQDVDKNIERISRYTKSKYIIKKILLQRFLVLGILLIGINLLFDLQDIRTKEFIYVSIIKIIIILLLGIIVGNFEWNLFVSLKNYEISLSKIRYRFILNMGILSWGLPIGIANMEYPVKSILNNGVHLLIWIIAGIFFGTSMWLVVSDEFKKHLDSNYNI